MRNLKSAFVSGLLLLAPVGVTLFVLNLLIQKVGVPTRQIVFFSIQPGDNPASMWMEYLLYLGSLVIVLLLICILGWLSQKLIGRFLVRSFERLVDSLPVIRSVYNTVKQIRDTFIQQQKAVFQQCVLIEYPRKGVWVLGFLTGHGKGEIPAAAGTELANVFVPTTPNPTSGFLLMIPENEIRPLKMSVPEGMKLIISGGAVVPAWERSELMESDLPKQEPDLPGK